METRANHLVIGIFVLLLVAGTFGFVVWLAGYEADRKFNHYHVFFEDSISGLSIGSDVRFRGVTVGRVTEILIDAERDSQIRVAIEVAADTPVRADSVASIEPEGITGIAFMQITGGRSNSPELLAQAGQPLPVIRSKKSQIAELFSGAPDLINRAIVLIENVNAMVDEKNRKSIEGILEGVLVTINTFAQRREELDRILVSADQVAADIAASSQQISELTAKANRLADDIEATLAVTRSSLTGVDELASKDLPHMVKKINAAADSVEQLSESISVIFVDNEKALSDFTGEGLIQMSRLIDEARQLVASLLRVSERIETDPARFLFGTKESEFKAE